MDPVYGIHVLAPLAVIVAIAYLRKSDNKTGRPSPAPWFVVGFAGLVVFNSLISAPPAATLIVANICSFLFAIALGAMGLETDWRKLNARGSRTQIPPWLETSNLHRSMESWSSISRKAKRRMTW